MRVLWAVPWLPFSQPCHERETTSTRRFTSIGRDVSPFTAKLQFRRATVHNERPAGGLRPQMVCTKREQSSSVEVLCREVVQHIAAGEVIDGLCAVIRELVENAIDAEANSIVVNIDPDSQCVTVYDNGVGITVELGLLRVATCNATSKIRSVEDLGKLGSLGFRGQGLWAVAMQSSDVVMASRTHSADFGTRVAYRQDGVPLERSVQHIAMAPGTIVHASGLRSLDFGAVERRQCRAWLIRAALCHLGTVFRLESKGRVLWSSAGWSELGLMDAFASMLGKSPEDFRSSSLEDENVGKVDVVVGLPSRVHFPTGNQIVLAVNGRCVDLPDLADVIRDVFRSLLPRRRYPGVFVHLNVTKRGACNWNLHPMKKTMRIGSKSAPCDAAVLVRRALYKALGYDANPDTTPPKIQSLLGSLMNTSALIEKPGVMENGEQGVLSFRAVGQALNTYIVAEFETGIMLIEQHVAHERILFERLTGAWAANFVEIAGGIELPDHVAGDDEKVFALCSLGFDVNIDDEGKPFRAVVRTVPEILLTLVGEDGIEAALVALSNDVSSDGYTINDAAASVSCRSAIKNGAPLNMKQMQTMLGDLMRCRSPRTCPHGRPIFLELGQRELASVFHRTWISKQSGIHASTASSIPCSGVARELVDGP
jgi:DNA mismatch repair protein MutL